MEELFVGAIIASLVVYVFGIDESDEDDGPGGGLMQPAYAHNDQ